MSDEFSFDKYDVEDLKEDLKSDFDKVKLKTSRTEPRTPAHYNAPQKEREFMNFDENEKDLFGKNEREINLDREEDDEIALPYDDGHGQGNSYLSLVLSPNLRELELMIRGLEYRKVFNQRTGKYEYKLKKIPNHPLNEYGINQIITQLKIYTSPEIKLGRKRTKDYYASVQHVAKTITRLIYKNLKSFGMDTQEKQRNAKMFCDAIIEVIDASYSRSIEGRENDLSRATDFRLEGRVDSAEDIPRALNKYRKEQAKN